MKHFFSMLALSGCVGLLSACDIDGVGSCAGINSDLGDNYRDICHDEWTEGECKEWDEIGVNGQTWVYQNSSCKTRGFTQECGTNTWLYEYESCY